MFKVLVLQKYHDLRNEATEVQIKDRLSFLAFLGLRLGDEVPDGNTIWDFKELIEKDGQQGSRRLFEVFHKVLTGEGLIAKEGSIGDASFIDAPRQRNSREENRQIKDGQRPEGFEPDTPKGRQKKSARPVGPKRTTKAITVTRTTSKPTPKASSSIKAKPPPPTFITAKSSWIHIGSARVVLSASGVEWDYWGEFLGLGLPPVIHRTTLARR